MKNVASRQFWRPGLLIWLAFPLILGWLAQDIPLSDWRTLLDSIKPANLVLLLAFNIFAAFFFSLRWWWILKALNTPIPYLAALRYRMAAFTISYFTPGAQFGGEPLQIYAVERRHRLPPASALASVTTDKLFEMLTNFTFLAVGVALILQDRLFDGPTPILAAIWAAGLLCLPLAYLAAVGSGRKPFNAFMARLRLWFPGRPTLIRLHGLILDSEAQVSYLIRQSPQKALLILAASIWISALSLTEYWLSASVLGASLSFRQAVIALTAARLAFLVPVPGGLGALEAGQVLAMQALGFNPALGLAIALWIRGRDVLLGFIGAALAAGLFKTRSSYSTQSIALSIQAGDSSQQ